MVRAQQAFSPIDCVLDFGREHTGSVVGVFSAIVEISVLV